MKLVITSALFALMALILGSIVIATRPLQPPAFEPWRVLASIAPPGLNDTLIEFNDEPFTFLPDRRFGVLLHRTLGVYAIGAYVFSLPWIFSYLVEKGGGKAGRAAIGASLLVGLCLGVYQPSQDDLGSVVVFNFGANWTGVVVGLPLAAAVCILLEANHLPWRKTADFIAPVVFWGGAAGIVAYHRLLPGLPPVLSPDILSQVPQGLLMALAYVGLIVSVLVVAAVPAVLFRALCRQGRTAFAVFAAMFGLYSACGLIGDPGLPLLARLGMSVGFVPVCAAVAWVVGGLLALGMAAPRPAGDVEPGSVGEG